MRRTLHESLIVPWSRGISAVCVLVGVGLVSLDGLLEHRGQVPRARNHGAVYPSLSPNEPNGAERSCW